MFGATEKICCPKLLYNNKPKAVNEDDATFFSLRGSRYQLAVYGSDVVMKIPIFILSSKEHNDYYSAQGRLSVFNISPAWCKFKNVTSCAMMLCLILTHWKIAF